MVGAICLLDHRRGHTDKEFSLRPLTDSQNRFTVVTAHTQVHSISAKDHDHQLGYVPDHLGLVLGQAVSH